MSTNPIKQRIPESKPKLSAQEWCDRGNRILAGIEPMTEGKHAGEYMRRTDVHWVLRDGRCVIEWV